MTDSAASATAAAAAAAAAATGSGGASGGDDSGTDAPFPFRVRTVTVGVCLKSLGAADLAKLTTAAWFLAGAKASLEREGYEVQTTRIVTNSFEDYLDTSSKEAIVAGGATLLKAIAAPRSGAHAGDGGDGAPGHGDVLLNVGPARSAATVALIPTLVASTPRITCSAHVPCEKSEWALVPDVAMAEACANCIRAIAVETTNGEGNFQFSATFNCPPGIPYFPAGYHNDDPGDTTFAVGLENPNLVVSAFKAAADAHPASTGSARSARLRAAAANIKASMAKELGTIQTLCEGLAVEECSYAGADASIAPSPGSGSLVEAYESLGLGTFGHSGSLTVSAMLTHALKSLPDDGIKLVGYSGLMLPPLEDSGLAARATEGTYRVADLLTYSAVCGLGLDTVPVPGDVSVAALTSLMCDICVLAFRLNKPLSCRLFPVPGKAAGEMTAFANPHMCDGAIFALQ